MKKIYFLLLLCLLSFKGFTQSYWYFNGNISYDITNLNNWSDTRIPASSTHPTAADKLIANAYWEVSTANPQIHPGDTFAIAGNMIVEGGTHILKTGTAPSYLMIGNSFIMNDSGYISSALPAGTLNSYFFGHVFINDSSYFSCSPINYNHIYLCDNLDSTGSFAGAKYISWSSTGQSRRTSITINRKSVRRLLTNLPLPVNSNVNDSLLGTLWCGTYTISCLDSAAFFVADSATILTAHANGLDGSVHMTNVGDSIWFSPQANYVYNGTVAQVTGLTLPDSIKNPLNVSEGSVTINNQFGVTLSRATDFESNSSLNLERGTLSNGTLLQMNANSWVKLDYGTLGSSPNYVFPVAVQYTNLGPNLPVVTTGNELTPTTSGTIGLFNIHKPGTTITLNSAPVVQTVKIDSAGSSVSGIPVLDVSSSNYNITTNKWNNQPGTGAFNARSGTVLFVPSPAPAMSQIKGATNFNGLTLNNSNHLELKVNTTVNGQLTLTAGLFYLNSDTLYLGPTAPAVAPGTFSPVDSNWIVDVKGYGEVLKQFTADGSYLYPIGDSANYSPITVDFSGTGSYGTLSYAGVTVSPYKHPSNANTTNYLKRYWSLDLNGTFTTPHYSVSTTYVPGDVNGSEPLLVMGQYIGGGLSPWVKYGPVVPTHTLTTGATVVTTSFAPNDYTGLDTTYPSVSINLTDTVLCSSVPVTTVTLTATSPTGDPTLSYTWAPSTGLSATTGASVTASPMVNTVYTLTITDGNGFTGKAYSSITVNPVPTVTSIAGNGHDLCYGDSIMLVATGVLNVATYSWTGPVALIGSTTGTVKVYTITTAATGNYVLTVTNGPGIHCANSYSYTVTEHDLPLKPTAGTAGTYCDTTTIFALGGTGTIYYEGTTRDSMGLTSHSPQTVNLTGTYYFRTHDDVYGCWGGQDSVHIVINPLPKLYNFTPLANGGYFCASDSGLHVIFASTDTGISYQLDSAGIAVGAPMLGTGGSLDFGLKHDSVYFSMTATDVHTGCIRHMNDSVLLNRVPLPADQGVLGGGGYCIGDAGVVVYLNNINPADSYWLYLNGALIDSNYKGYTDSMAFGTYTAAGVYTVMAKDIAHGCIDTMSTHDSVWINPLPNRYHVWGGGSDCLGGGGVPVNLSWADSNTAYQLLVDGSAAIGSITSSVNDTFHFGYQTTPGTYTVIATSPYGCVDTMLDSTVVVINPLPGTFPVMESIIHDYCVYDTLPVVISLGGSEPGKSYQLYYNNVALGAPMAGTGSPLNFGSFTDTGTYTVSATDTATLCNTTMTGSAVINIHYRPTVYNVTGAGSICAGSAGVDITLSGQETGVTYKLWFGGSVISTITSTGTGSLDLGLQTGMGIYTVTASSTFTCTVNMTGSATVTVNALPTVYNVTGGGAHCFPGASFNVGLSGADTGVSYKLYRDSTTLIATHFSTTTSGSFNYGSYATPGNYTVVATRLSTGCIDTMHGFANITIYPLPIVDTVSGNGIFCAGAPGSQVFLSGSQSGVNYVLYRDTISAPIESMSGTGGILNFGYQSLGGIYKVVATNTTTGCVSNMDSFAYLIRNPLPAVYTLAGGGGYCIGGAGLPIYLAASNTGIKYTLYRTGTPTPVGVVSGTGFGIGYGTFPTAGTYNAIAVDTLTGCSSPMANTITISINGLPAAYNVSGGGSGCAGTGFHDSLSGSTPGIQYNIYNGLTLAGSMVGTGSPLAFGPFATSGTYTVIAKDLTTLCTDSMNGSATITEWPLPRFDNITGGGSYCAGDSGVFLGLDSSVIGVNYQAVLGGLNIGGPRIGSGNAINFGRFTLPGYYRIWGHDLLHECVDTMNGTKLISINLLPNQYAVTGGGTYCTLDSGLHVGLGGSNIGISYKLFNGSGLVGSPWAGDGAALDFGLQTTAGSYIVTAVNDTTGCKDTMSGATNITIMPIQVPVVKLKAFPDTLVTVGKADTVVATIISGGGGGVTYQWLINNNIIYGATSDTLIFPVYFDKDSIVCQVTSGGSCGGITTSQLIVIQLYVNAVPVVKTADADIRLIPNPNTGVFSLKGRLADNINEDVTVEVTDMLGQIVYNSKIPVKNGLINEHIQLSSNLANGMYLLNLHSGSVSSVIHFVVEQ